MGSVYIIFDLCGKVEIHPKQASLWECLLQSPGEGKAKQKGYQDGPTRSHRKVEGKNLTQLSSALYRVHTLPSPTYTQTFPFKEAKPVFTPMLVGAGEPRLVVYKTGL